MQLVTRQNTSTLCTYLQLRNCFPTEGAAGTCKRVPTLRFVAFVKPNPRSFGQRLLFPMRLVTQGALCAKPGKEGVEEPWSWELSCLLARHAGLPSDSNTRSEALIPDNAPAQGCRSCGKSLVDPCRTTDSDDEDVTDRGSNTHQPSTRLSPSAAINSGILFHSNNMAAYAR